MPFLFAYTNLAQKKSKVVIAISSDVISLPDTFNIIDKAIKDVSNKVLGLPIQNATAQDMAKQNMQAEEIRSLVISTYGDYCMTIVFSAERDILCAIARNMKHGADACDADIAIYTTEFFNILCGQIISAINMKNHVRARFGIPQVVKGAYVIGVTEDNLYRQEYFYRIDYGTIKLEIISRCQQA